MTNVLATASRMKQLLGREGFAAQWWYISYVPAGTILPRHTDASGTDRKCKKRYSFCPMVEASDHGYVLHTRRIQVTRYRIRYDMI
jgi:hypothetical protein